MHGLASAQAPRCRARVPSRELPAAAVAVLTPALGLVLWTRLHSPRLALAPSATILGQGVPSWGAHLEGRLWPAGLCPEGTLIRPRGRALRPGSALSSATTERPSKFLVTLPCGSWDPCRG